jgi:PhnB protein
MAQLAPYIFFYGRCAEALAFYQSILGGSYELQRVGDSPMSAHMPPEAHDRVMHATFTAPGITFMGSDGRETKPVDPDEGNISLSLGYDDRAEGERVFNALADGGAIDMPYGDAAWGGAFGVVNDRFGTQWMIVGP